MDYFALAVGTAHETFTYSPATDPSAVAIESLTISPDALSHHFIARARILDLQPEQMVAAMVAVEREIRAIYPQMQSTGWRAASDGLRIYFTAWTGRADQTGGARSIRSPEEVEQLIDRLLVTLQDPTTPNRRPTMTTIPPFTTEAPRLSEATLTQICAMARQYVLAGGGLFPHALHDSDRDEHIGNVDRALHPHDAGEAFSDLLTTTVPAYDEREPLYSAAWQIVTDHAEAGFIFGALVGLEFAGFVLGRQMAPAADPPSRREE